jgi:hypothetical protein
LPDELRRLQRKVIISKNGLFVNVYLLSYDTSESIFGYFVQSQPLTWTDATHRAGRTGSVGIDKGVISEPGAPVSRWYG